MSTTGATPAGSLTTTKQTHGLRSGADGMGIIPNGVYGIVAVEDDPAYGAVGVLSFLTSQFSWFSPLYHLNKPLETLCVEPVRNRWLTNPVPRYVRFIGTDKVYRYRARNGLWYGRSRSLLIPMTHPTMR